MRAVEIAASDEEETACGETVLVCDRPKEFVAGSRQAAYQLSLVASLSA